MIPIASFAAEHVGAQDTMRRVAANQDIIESGRIHYVYDQTVRVTTRHRNGKLMCQQDTQYVVTPSEKGSDRKMVWTKGKYWHGGRYIDFDKDFDGDPTLDTGMVKSFRDQLVTGKSKDGMARDLFPFTTEAQKQLEFELGEERRVQDRPAQTIRFRPRDEKEFGWSGEAVIDNEEFQPITVYTQMSRKLPFVVRHVLGTDVPGLGFTTQYKRVARNVWFPESFGSEFKIDAVYFFHRIVTISAHNTNFRRTSVDSDIHFETPSN